MAGENKHARQKAFLEQLTTQQLQQIIREELFFEDVDESELVDTILEILTERSENDPNAPSIDVEAAWENLMHRYESGEHDIRFPMDAELMKELDKPIRKRRKQILLRTVAIAAMVAVIVLAVVPPVFGRSGIFTVVGRWTDDLFRFEGVSSPLPDAAQNIDGIHPELYAAYEKCGIPLDLAPRNIPEDVSVSGISTTASNDFSGISFWLQPTSENVCLVQIVKYNSSNTAPSIYEKSTGDPQKYLCHDKLFYIFDNLESRHAVWSNGQYDILISGEVPEDVLFRILDLF